MGKRALVMAGGTGGHIFPGLAVAEALRDRSWDVHWLGAPGSMESRLVPPRGFTLETIDFGGVRGKGPITLALLPLRLLRAFWQSIRVVRRVKPDVVIGLGGYITFPGGMMGVLLGKPLLGEPATPLELVQQGGQLSRIRLRSAELVGQFEARVLAPCQEPQGACAQARSRAGAPRCCSDSSIAAGTLAHSVLKLAGPRRRRRARQSSTSAATICGAPPETPAASRTFDSISAASSACSFR